MKYWISLVAAIAALHGSPSWADDPLSPEQQMAEFRRVTALDGMAMQDAGSYLVVRTPSAQQYIFFTKVGHPAHPGIVEFTLRVENGRIFLDSKGTHGPDEKAFEDFQGYLNEQMLKIAREVNGSGS